MKQKKSEKLQIKSEILREFFLLNNVEELYERVIMFVRNEIKPFLDKIETDGLEFSNNISNKNSIKKIKWVEINRYFIPNSISNENKIVEWKQIFSKFITSLNNHNEELLLFVGSEGKNLILAIGMDDNKLIENNLTSFFSGVNFKLNENIINILTKENYSVFGGGIPTTNINNEKEKFASINLPIDKLLMSLYGENFYILFRLYPINEKEIIENINSLSDSLNTTALLYELAAHINEGVGYNVKISLSIKIEVVNRLKEVLENNINRLRAGLNKGLWNTEIRISSNEKNVTNKAAELFKSIYSNEDPKGMRIQIRDRAFYTELTSDEISEFFSLPSIEFPGIAVNEIYEFGCNQFKNKKGIKIGEILFNLNKTGNYVIIPFSSLVRHTLIAGMTGSGKTTTVKTIIKGLNDYKVPFLLIEPVKSEYKEIDFVKFIELGEDKFSIDLFRPAVAKTPIIQHIDYLRAVFNASFVLYPPMPYVLEKAIYHCYEQKGFKFDNSDFTLKNYPTIFDLIKSIEVVINEVNYSPRLRDDILASLKIRLENLTKGYKGEIFCGSNVLNFELLMKENVIINLDKIVDDEQKSILMSILLVNLFEYNQSLGNTKDLRHITIVEEAHRLLSNESKLGSPDFANPKFKSVEFFANLISEIRSYGEGLIIAEQIPTKLLQDVIKNTSTKIIHKLVSHDDKYAMGSSMNFLEGQERVLTLLESGQAIFFSEEMFKPIIIKVNYH